MAQKIIKIDDIDGSEGPDVLGREFEILDREFAIDLSEENNQRLHELLKDLDAFIVNATEIKRVSTPAQRPKNVTKLASGHTTTDVRDWAKKNGIPVSEGGRIATEVYDRYYEAFPDAKPE